MDYISKGQFPPEKGRSTTPQPPTQYSTPAPHPSQYQPPMNPRLSPPRYGYDTSPSRSSSPQPVGPNGTLVLVDRDDGYQVGALDGALNTSGVVPGSHEPVEIDLTRPDGVVTVRTVSADYLKDSQHPAYANSRLVSTAASASRTLVAGASLLANAMSSGAKTFTEKTTPNVVPMTFAPTTHSRVRTIHNATSSTAQLSSQTIGKLSHYTQNFGARLAGKTEDRPHKEIPDKPGYFNKGVIAFSTIADSIDHATRLILTSGGEAATRMVAHKYGAEAGEVARGLTGAVKNVGLVYIDASGVSRRAVVKSVAKGMVVGKVRGGGEVVFDGENQSTGALHPQGTGLQQNQQAPPGYSQQQQTNLYSPQPQHAFDAQGVHRANTFPSPHPAVGRQDSGLSQYTSYTGHSQSGRTTPTMTAMGYVSPQPTGGTYASAQAYQQQQQGYGGEKQGGGGGQFRY